MQTDQAALAQHLGALIREIWQREKSGRPNLRAASFEGYAIQAGKEDQPQLFRERELILEATENGYQGHGLTEADGEAVERHERLSIQQAHERELQRQAHEREQEREAERQKQAEDLKTRQAELILNFVDRRLDEENLTSLKTRDKAYSITRDSDSQMITLTRVNGGVMLQGKAPKSGGDISLNNIQPADVQNFTRYQAEREEKAKQPKQKQRVKFKDRGIGD